MARISVSDNEKLTDVVKRMMNMVRNTNEIVYASYRGVDFCARPKENETTITQSYERAKARLDTEKKSKQEAFF